MKKNKKETPKREERTFDYGTHPGAYVTEYDVDNLLLDTVDSSDKAFVEDISATGKPANMASPPAADPPVPNRAHTGI